MSVPSAVDTFAALPDPGRASSLDDLIALLRRLKVWAGDPSYDAIADRINRAWRAAGRPDSELTRRNTVADCFRPGRRRLNPDLVRAVVRALHADPTYEAQWRQALRVLTGVTEAAGQVRVQTVLPDPPDAFVGRSTELDRLDRAAAGPGPSVLVVTGMAGVGKTRLVTHAGRQLTARAAYRRVLFVDLRGLHADPAQPPADPAGVLGTFLRLLGVPDRLVPHDLAGRSGRYREWLGRERTLVILDDAAGEDQVRPLLPGDADALVLVTSRTRLPGLAASHLTLPVFTPAEALEYLARARPGPPARSPEPDLARVADRCGHLPLALRLTAEHIRDTPDWTLADHADRLEEHHRQGRLDPAVARTLALSYRRLPVATQRQFRRLALHPGADFDAYAAAALAGLGPDDTRSHLRRLGDDHLLHEHGTDRYAWHELVGGYARGLTDDLDPPAARSAAQARLFDFYLTTAAAAARTLRLGEGCHRPDDPPAPAVPGMSRPATARRWLEAERHNLVAITEGAGTRHLGDDPVRAHLLGRLGVALAWLGRPEDAAGCHRRALAEFRRLTDRPGEACALNGLGEAEQAAGRPADALAHHVTAAALAADLGDRPQQARAHAGLGIAYRASGDPARAEAHEERARALRTGLPLARR